MVPFPEDVGDLGSIDADQSRAVEAGRRPVVGDPAVLEGHDAAAIAQGVVDLVKADEDADPVAAVEPGG